MGKSNIQDYILWDMTPQEEKNLVNLIDQYAKCKFWNGFPNHLTHKKFLKGYDLFAVKMWSGCVDRWYEEMTVRGFGDSLAFLVEQMKQRGLLNQEEAKILPFWSKYADHRTMFPLPKNVDARMVLLKALFELSTEKDDIEWGMWKSEKVLALKLKFYQYTADDEQNNVFGSLTTNYLKKYKIIE